MATVARTTISRIRALSLLKSSSSFLLQRAPVRGLSFGGHGCHGPCYVAKPLVLQWKL